ncbi:sulfotransferase [Thermotomaculum hydrothermale]|nr:sulfotransferase [Thermotomaculum hydrothermale]
MPLPEFFCVGAAKSGTTTLHNILIQHPDIFLPDVKETH